MREICPYSNIRHARKNLKLAIDELHQAIRDDLPIGTRVEWSHGRYVRSGVVVKHDSSWDIEARVYVQSTTGKSYWIPVYWIVFHWEATH